MYVKIDWAHSADELRALYHAERDGKLRQRYHALWLLRQQHRTIDAMAACQICQGQRDSILLTLCADGLYGILSWLWIIGMQHEEILRGLRLWNVDGFDAVVWDNASSHRDAAVQSWGMPLVPQPAYASELNPAERVNKEIRRHLKGKTFRTLAEKMLVVENLLRRWKADHACIQRLYGYSWIRECFDLLEQVSSDGGSRGELQRKHWQHKIAVSVLTETG